MNHLIPRRTAAPVLAVLCVASFSSCGSSESVISVATVEPTPAQFDTTPLSVATTSVDLPPTTVASTSTTVAVPTAVPLEGRDACSLLDAADIEAIFGGTVAAGGQGSRAQCNFLISGETNFGSLDPTLQSPIVILGDPPGSLVNLDADTVGEPYSGPGEEAYSVVDRFGQIRVRFRSGLNEVLVGAGLAVPDPAAAMDAVRSLAQLVFDRLALIPPPTMVFSPSEVQQMMAQAALDEALGGG